VAAPTIFTKAEQKFLRELARRRVDFMIVGLAAAALQGAPAVTQDIDLWFKDLSDPRLQDALKRVGGIYVPPTATTPPMLAGKSVALFDIVFRMDGLRGFDHEIHNAVEVPIGGTKIRVLSLERIVASKKAANRAKDRAILPVLEDAVATLKQRQRGKAQRRRKD
jgi:predicted nucleotidyltransferase